MIKSNYIFKPNLSQKSAKASFKFGIFKKFLSKFKTFFKKSFLSSLFLSAFLSIFLSACFVNERGVSNRFYDDCKEYYDAAGMYHQECPQNWIDLPLTPKAAKKALN